MAVTLRFIFISDADKPTVTLKVPEDMLFHFLQCATVATPKDVGWTDRAAEEVYALDRFHEYLRFLEKDDWFSIRPTSDSKTRWTGKVLHGGKSWDIELALKDSYPQVPP